MILDLSQISQFIKEPDSKELIEQACKAHEELDMHVNGNNVIKYLEQISNFENKDQLDLRHKTVISNRHLFNSIIRVLNKIFSAKGGSVYYDMPESKADEFRDKLNDIKGVTLRRWIQNKAFNKYITDPNGVLLIEYKTIDSCYPTYKSINSIHDYQKTGRKLEYVIFKLEDDFYRVYDDAFDYLVKFKDGAVEIIQDKSYPNPWGKVPGIIVGDLFHSTLDIYDSRFSIAVELANKYLRTNSVKNVYEFAHGFPLMWKLLTAKCKTCEGTGLIEGKVCTQCRGTGYYIKKDVSDVIGVIPPRTKDEPELVPNIAGYVQPDLETWKEFRIELEWLEKLIQYALLGSYIISANKDATEKTATESFIDSQPVNDTLNDYADWVEETEKYLTNFMGEFYYQNTFKGSSINLGRRYMIEKTDDLWNKYLESKEKGAPPDKLDDDMIEYYESKYANDSKTLEIQKKLFYANEYRHLTIGEAKSSLPENEYLKRVYFDGWLLTLTEEEIIKSNNLREDYLIYFKTKLEENAKTVSGTTSRQENEGTN